MLIINIHSKKNGITFLLLSAHQRYYLAKFKKGLSQECGEGNGKPLQYSYLENPMDRGAWWATVHGSLRVGQS